MNCLMSHTSVLHPSPWLLYVALIFKGMITLGKPGLEIVTLGKRFVIVVENVFLFRLISPC